jgi:hypothetical protein
MDELCSAQTSKSWQRKAALGLEWCVEAEIS